MSIDHSDGKTKEASVRLKDVLGKFIGMSVPEQWKDYVNLSGWGLLGPDLQEALGLIKEPGLVKLLGNSFKGYIQSTQKDNGLIGLKQKVRVRAAREVIWALSVGEASTERLKLAQAIGDSVQWEGMDKPWLIGQTTDNITVHFTLGLLMRMGLGSKAAQASNKGELLWESHIESAKIWMDFYGKNLPAICEQSAWAKPLFNRISMFAPNFSADAVGVKSAQGYAEGVLGLLEVFWQQKLGQAHKENHAAHEQYAHQFLLLAAWRQEASPDPSGLGSRYSGLGGHSKGQIKPHKSRAIIKEATATYKMAFQTFKSTDTIKWIESLATHQWNIHDLSVRWVDALFEEGVFSQKEAQIFISEPIERFKRVAKNAPESLSLWLALYQKLGGELSVLDEKGLSLVYIINQEAQVNKDQVARFGSPGTENNQHSYAAAIDYLLSEGVPPEYIRRQGPLKEECASDPIQKVIEAHVLKRDLMAQVGQSQLQEVAVPVKKPRSL